MLIPEPERQRQWIRLTTTSNRATPPQLDLRTIVNCLGWSFSVLTYEKFLRKFVEIMRRPTASDDILFCSCVRSDQQQQHIWCCGGGCLLLLRMGVAILLTTVVLRERSNVPSETSLMADMA